MSGLLAKLNLTNARILNPEETLAILASRGEWKALAQAVAQKLRSANGGTFVPMSSVTFAELGLTVEDFKRTTATDTKPIGSVDYSGIIAASRSFGLVVKPTVDEFRCFYVPFDYERRIVAAAEQAAKTAAANKVKAAKAKAAKAAAK